MELWIGGVVGPEVSDAFRAARTPLVSALQRHVGDRDFGAPIDFWSLTPLLVAEAMPFREEAKYRRRQRELDFSFALSVVEFLSADTATRIALLGGLLKRSVRVATDLGVAPLDVDEFMRAIELAVVEATRNAQQSNPLEDPTA